MEWGKFATAHGGWSETRPFERFDVPRIIDSGRYLSIKRHNHINNVLLPHRDQGRESYQWELREVEDLLSDLIEDSMYFTEDLAYLRRSLTELLSLSRAKK